LAQGQIAEFEGEIVYVHPFIESGNVYRVWAEVANRLEDDQWLLRPGQTATMTIDLKDRVPPTALSASSTADSKVPMEPLPSQE
jgi:fido (protein-threonine AMPylation protein)